MPDNEHLLIKGCIRGDRSSQSQLYNLYAQKMLALCMRYARNREEAEEIIQDGFVRAFTYIRQFNSTGSLEGWIRKIMVNCALMRYQKNIHRAPVVELNTEYCIAKDDRDIVAILNAKELLKLIQALTPAYRMVFNLYVFEGMKHREIAELLGISEGTSKSNLFNARTTLQKALLRQGSAYVFKTKNL